MNRRRFLSAGALTAGASTLASTGWAADPIATLHLTPQATQGPFWFDPKLMRADITEGKPGVPLGLRLTVREADGQPVSQALVEVWHCDAQGNYSGYSSMGGGRAPSTGARFLRGGQTTDSAGGVEFATLYPGWYNGRAPHVHFKVMLGEGTVLTSQVFLPDALNEFIYTHVPAYKRDGVRDTLNSQDGIARALDHFTAADVREQAHRYLASLAVVIDRKARSVEAFGPGGPPPPGMGPPPPGFGPPPGMGPPGMGPPGFGPPLQGEARLAALIPGLRKVGSL